jgi:hypothetical protein
MWLTGRLAPDHKTIADFRKECVANDRTEIGFSEVCLSKRAAELTKVLNDDVDRDVIFGVQWGQGTQLHNA